MLGLVGRNPDLPKRSGHICWRCHLEDLGKVGLTGIGVKSDRDPARTDVPVHLEHADRRAKHLVHAAIVVPLRGHSGTLAQPTVYTLGRTRGRIRISCREVEDQKSRRSALDLDGPDRRCE